MGITVFVPGLHCVVMTLVVAGAVNGPRLRLGHAVKTGYSHCYSLIISPNRHASLLKGQWLGHPMSKLEISTGALDGHQGNDQGHGGNHPCCFHEGAGLS